jgi:hypothetical protein
LTILVSWSTLTAADPVESAPAGVFPAGGAARDAGLPLMEESLPLAPERLGCPQKTAEGAATDAGTETLSALSWSAAYTLQEQFSFFPTSQRVLTGLTEVSAKPNLLLLPPRGQFVMRHPETKDSIKANKTIETTSLDIVAVVGALMLPGWGPSFIPDLLNVEAHVCACAGFVARCTPNFNQHSKDFGFIMVIVAFFQM